MNTNINLFLPNIQLNKLQKYYNLHLNFGVEEEK